jgi:tRNA G18 (ribose-2'-O)-methylase SpoU
VIEQDTRNVADVYKYWTNEAIKADLDSKRHGFSVLVSNIKYDFNIGSVIRNSNAFLAKKVYIYGRGQWDRRGAVGTHNYINVEKRKDLSNLDEYTWVGIDNIPGAEPLDSFNWPKNTLMCFGQEQTGLTKEIIDKCSKIVYIRQFGSVRSLNVGCASAIAMYDYCVKMVS